MPQMSPISWMQIMTMLIFLTIQMKSILYFEFMNFEKMKKKKKTSINLKW